MNWQLYFTLLRPVRSLLIAVPVLGLIWIFQFFAAQFAGNPQAHAFSWWVCTVPLIAGFIISETINAPLHRPFAMHIPDMRRHLARWHAGVTGFLTLTCTGVAWASDHALPPLAISGLCTALLTLTLPKNRDQSGAFIGLVLILILSAATYIAELLRQFVLTHAWIIAASTWVVAWLCFQFRFSRRQLRRSARTPYTSLLNASATRDYAAQQKKEVILQTVKSPSAWTGNPTPASDWSYLKAALYECTGKSVVRFYLPTTRAALLGVAGVCLIATRWDERLARDFYSLVWTDEKQSFQATIMLICILFFLNRRPWILRPTACYPISQVRLGKIAYKACLLDMLVFFVGLIGGIFLIAGIIAIRLGWPTPLLPAAKQLSLMLWLVPFIPIAQWSSLQKHVFPRTPISVWQIVFGTVVVIATLIFFVWSAMTLVPTWNFLQCLLWIAVSQFALYSAIMHRYRKGDWV